MLGKTAGNLGRYNSGIRAVRSNPAVGYGLVLVVRTSNRSLRSNARVFFVVMLIFIKSMMKFVVCLCDLLMC